MSLTKQDGLTNHVNSYMYVRKVSLIRDLDNMQSFDYTPENEKQSSVWRVSLLSF